VLTKKDENQLLVFERKVLRTMCGLKIENGVYRRLRYDGHMIRRPEDLPQKALFKPNPLEAEIKEDRNPGGLMGR
jgi:hypothetical protein